MTGFWKLLIRYILAIYFIVNIISLSIAIETSEPRKYVCQLYKESHLTIDLMWDVDYKQNVAEFTLKLTGEVFDPKSSVLVGFGMSDHGDVNNADIMMIKYNDDGISITDSWSDDEGSIHDDNVQNYYLNKYHVTHDLITIGFWRYFDTNDKHDYKLDNETTNLIYLLKTDDETDETADNAFPSIEDILINFDNPINVHDFKSGFIPVQLLKPEIPDLYFVNKNDGEILTFSILQSNRTIPAQDTTYWWSVHKLPDEITGKVHGIAFGGDISENSNDLIHHIMAFLCDPEDGDVSEYNGISKADDIPNDVRRCNRVVAAWAKGAEIFWYPKETGMPFGGIGQSRYFRLEVHYNNPDLVSGVVDQSGIKFFYTKNLREYDSGILEVGITYNENLAIPPHQEDFVLAGYCPQQCTKKGLLPDGINVFASQLHTHLAGRKVWISHSRDDIELPELNRDDHYSTFFEEIRHIYPSRKVMPGDSLTTYCSYDTSNNKNVTTTGLALNQEMCVSYLHYYPVSPLELCKSSTSTSALTTFFVIEKLITGRPKQVNLKNFAQNYKEMKWDNDTSSELDAFYKIASQDVACLHHDGSSFNGNWNGYTIN